MPEGASVVRGSKERRLAPSECPSVATRYSQGGRLVGLLRVPSISLPQCQRSDPTKNDADTEPDSMSAKWQGEDSRTLTPLAKAKRF